MVIRGIALNPELLALLAQMARHLLVDVLEHGRALGFGPSCSVPWLSASFCGLEHFRVDLGLHLLVALLAPGADADQMVLQPLDRIAERPGGSFVLRPVFRTDRPRSNARRRDR